MKDAIEASQLVRRDFIFLVSGIPSEMRISHEHHALVGLGETERREIERIAVKQGGLADWLRRAGSGISVAIFRNDFSSETEGFTAAFKQISSILDGYTFLTEDTTPELSPLVLIRVRDEHNACAKIFSQRAMVRWGNPTAESALAWKERKSLLKDRWIAFFDSVAGDSKVDTEIVRQLGLSARMYRHGQRAAAYDVEFLCKFTALEGLVCGSRRSGHIQLLTSRLPLLFRNWPELKEEIKRLWEYRCAASHQGNSSHEQMSTLIEPVAKLTLGVFVFALDNIGAAKSIDELWECAADYQLSNNLTISHPQQSAVVTHLMGDIGTWPDVGGTIDSVFHQLQSIRRAAQN